MVAATAVGADEVVLYVKRSNPRVWAGVLRAVDERRAAGARGPTLRIVAAPEQLRQRPGDGGDRAHQRQAGAADDGPAAAVRARRRQPSDLHQQRRDAGAHGAHRAPRRRLVPHARVADAARERARDAGWRRRTPRGLRDRLRQPAGRPAPSRGRGQRAPAGAAGRRLRRRLARRAAHAGPDAERGRSAARRRLDRGRRPLGPRRGLVRSLGDGARPGLPRRSERRPVRTVPARAARHRRQLRPRRPRHGAPGRAHAAEALGRPRSRAAARAVTPTAPRASSPAPSTVFAGEIEGHRAGRCAGVHAPAMPLPSAARAAA